MLSTEAWTHFQRAQLPRPQQRSEILVEILKSLDDALAHALLGSSDPLPRVIIALVGLVFALWVANLPLQIAGVLLVEFEEALPVCPLRVRVHVHLHHAVAHCLLYVGLLGARAAVENEEERLRVAHLWAKVLLELV